MKTCACCGTTYTPDQWEALPCKGIEMGLDWRDCRCGSTLTVQVAEYDVERAVGEALLAMSMESFNG